MPWPVGRCRPMTLQTKHRSRSEEIRIILCPMNIVATKTGHAAQVHRAGNEIVPLHAVSMPGAIRKVGGIRAGRMAVVEFPKLFQNQTGAKTDGPRIIPAFNRVPRGIAGRVTLYANIVSLDEIKPHRIDNIAP